VGTLSFLPGVLLDTDTGCDWTRLSVGEVGLSNTLNNWKKNSHRSLEKSVQS